MMATSSSKAYEHRPSPIYTRRLQMNLAPSAFVADCALLEALAEHSLPVPFDEERVLFRQGEAAAGVYVMRRGEAVLTMQSATGDVVMRLRATAGSVLGLPALIGNEPYSLTATAERGATVAYVPREDFDALMRTNPLLSFKVLQVLAAEVRSARQAIFHL
jgi:CRP-like cAMP-binding protein